MSCRHREQRSWPTGMSDDTLRQTHKIQDEHHRYERYMRYMNENMWHSQATYNLAVRQEMRKRGLL